MTSFWPIFLRITQCHKHQGTIYKDPQVFVAATVELISSFFKTSEVFENRKFRKESTFSTEKETFWPNFPCIIERDKWQETNYKGPHCTLTIIVQMTRTFLWDLGSRYKQTCQKLAIFTLTKVFGPVFLVLSSVTHLREQLIRVHKEFWQLLWNL